MKVVNSIQELYQLEINNTFVAIGKFDGLHKGHRVIIDKLIDESKYESKSVVITFTNNPKIILENKLDENIFTLEEQIYYFEKHGLDILVVLPLSEEILKIEAVDFIKKILVDSLGVKKIICGSDFRFGKARKGDIELLKELGNEYNYQVEKVEKIFCNEEEISSSKIREMLKSGDVENANRLLGHEFSFVGKIIHGQELGRTINVPTANMMYEKGKIIIPFGVYYSYAYIDGKLYKGVTNVGNKPTVEGDHQLGVETFFIDYSGDLYSRVMEINLIKYMRPEKKYKDFQELKVQIYKDIEYVKSQKLPL